MGSCAWTKTFGGTRSDSCKGITVDNVGNPILAGSFSDVVNFGSTILTSSGGMDLFLGKFSGSRWQRHLGAQIWGVLAMKCHPASREP
jgi:hypothetical protein